MKSLTSLSLSLSSLLTLSLALTIFTFSCKKNSSTPNSVATSAEASWQDPKCVDLIRDVLIKDRILINAHHQNLKAQCLSDKTCLSTIQANLHACLEDIEQQEKEYLLSCSENSNDFTRSGRQAKKSSACGN